MGKEGRQQKAASLEKRPGGPDHLKRLAIQTVVYEAA